MRDIGKDGTVKKFDKLFAEQEKNHEQELQRIKESLKYRLEEKNEEIRELGRKQKEYNSRKNRNQSEQHQEVVNLYDLIQKQHYIIRDIQNGVYSQAREVDFPEVEIPDLPNVEEYPLTFELLDKNEYRFRPKTGKSRPQTSGTARQRTQRSARLASARSRASRNIS